jgi:hypothetical protein
MPASAALTPDQLDRSGKALTLRQLWRQWHADRYGARGRADPAGNEAAPPSEARSVAHRLQPLLLLLRPPTLRRPLQRSLARGTGAARSMMAAANGDMRDEAGQVHRGRSVTALADWSAEFWRQLVTSSGVGAAASAAHPLAMRGGLQRGGLLRVPR